MKQFEHGGNIHKMRRDSGSTETPILDFSANINPLGPPEWFRSFVSKTLADTLHYPDPEYREFTATVAEYAKVDRESIVVANGTTELLYVIARVLPCKRALIPVPSYVDYVKAAKLGDLEVATFQLLEEDAFTLQITEFKKQIRPDDLVIIGTPNNPTGTINDRDELLSLATEFPGTTFLFDEAFLDFIDDRLSVAGCGENILTINSMTKFFAVPGLRIGYGTLPPKLAALVRENIPPWTVNSIAQAVGTKAIQDTGYHQATRAYCNERRSELLKELKVFPQLRVFESPVNYLFIQLLSDHENAKLAKFCFDRGVMIRKCDNYDGLNTSFFRIAVRTKKENLKLIEIFKDFFGSTSLQETGQKKKTASIMFQGTCSDAGKSILTAALCRILFQDGVNVAPFKSQNMSLNSFVTLQGDEMGRAQVVQAQAAKLDPDCRMNPILLKPNSDTGSQIIVNGKPVGNMSVLEYNEYKAKAWQTVCNSYDSLADEHDVIVLEGAGSPGEVNLKAHDIVNMKMARYADSPVLLVGDIDRGGVYASFVGTMEVLAEWERNLIAGFIVNKFRGQASLLASAHEYVKDHTGRDVFGVIPHLANLGLPEEDSVSFKKGLFNREKSRQDSVDIALINLPHISNFTDFEPFLDEPDVNLRIVNKVSELGFPQAIILPGSKNVIHDLNFLQNEGFSQPISDLSKKGCEIVGICAGYQMLGSTIKDPYAIESAAGDINGLDFLKMDTIIERDKRLTRINGVHSDSGARITGYEIHHGISTEADAPLFYFDDNSSCGTVDDTGRIWGCYIHGVFDSDRFRRWFIDRLRSRIGLQPVGEILAPYDLEASFDRLADCVRNNIDMDAVYRLLKM